MKITDSSEFYNALKFYATKEFYDLKKNEQECFRKTLIASIETIKDSKLEIKNVLEYELGINKRWCRGYTTEPNCKQIAMVAFLSDEDKETILKKYFKEESFGYISDNDMLCIFTLLNNISEEILIKAISESDNTKMFQIMSKINKESVGSSRKRKKDLDRYYNIFRKALSD